jgi:cytochrome b561
MNTRPSHTATDTGAQRPAVQAVQRPGDHPRRYHAALIALHWLLALLLCLALVVGTLVLKEIPNDSIDKIGALRGHMVMGVAIGALMLVRLIVRWRTRRPPAASAGNAALDRLRVVAHAALYLLVFAMAASGAALALTAGLPDIVFGRATTPLPASFAAYPPRMIHGWIAKALMLVIGFHLIGALYHQFRLKDRLLARMWFGSNHFVQHQPGRKP